MKKIALTLASASVWGTVTAYADSDLFSSIQYWVGTGQNEAAFEIDWNDGSADSAMVWGYRWDGTATGEQMLDAIAAADPRLYAEVSTPDEFGSGLGTALYGLGYHASGDQNFQLSPSLNFNSDHLAYADAGGVNSARTPVAAGDLWEEGWFSLGYWSYWASTDSQLSPSDPTDWANGWQYSGVGMSSRDLENGDVDGWDFSFFDGSGDSNPAIPVPAQPVPEPSAWAMMSLGGFGMIYFRRKS